MSNLLRDIETQLNAAEMHGDTYYLVRVLTEIRQIVDKAQAEARHAVAPLADAGKMIPADVLEGLREKVLAEITTYGLRAGTNIATSPKSVRRRINALFDAALAGEKR